MIDKKLITGLTEEKHIMKVLEEMHELGEVLTKYLNKQPEYRPKKEKIIEESGDLLYRMTLMIKKLGIEDEVNERFKVKSDQINEWYKDKLKD